MCGVLRRWRVQLIRAATFWLAFAFPVFASEIHEKALVLIVVGASGEDQYQAVFQKSEKLWREAAAKGGAEAVTIGLEGSPKPESEEDRKALEHALAKVRSPSLAPAWIVLIGHGTDNGKEAKFNLRGHDFSAAELAGWLKDAQRPLVILNTASASGGFLKPLAGTNRVVITATRSGNEVNYARFGGYLAESIGSLEADLDKDNQTSLLEAFLMASRKTQDFYKDEGRLASEHALVDDNGDGFGTPADWFQGVRAVKKAQKGESVDGRRAHQMHLISNAEDRDLPPQARLKRDELEMKIAALRDRKTSMEKEAYYKELEPLLIELARLYEGSEAVK